MLDDAVPVISFHRAGGESFVLGAPKQGQPASLLYGSQGLGVSPVSVASSPRLAGHGSTLRGKRLEGREIFIPVLLEAPTMSDLNTIRDELTRILSPLDPRELTLRVSVEGRDGWREIPVHYVNGLSGDYGDGYYGDWQSIGLEFEALDALWRGEPVQYGRQITPSSKPFLSKTEHFFPIILSSSVVTGGLAIDVEGDAPTAPMWMITPPGDDLLIEHVDTGAKFFMDGLITEPISLDMKTGRLVAETEQDGQLWDRVSVDSRIFELTPGHNRLKFVMAGATELSRVDITYTPQYLAGY